MARDERLELTDELSVATERQVGVDPFLDSDQTKLFEPGISLRANGS